MSTVAADGSLLPLRRALSVQTYAKVAGASLLSLNLFGLGAVIFTVFYGMGWVLRGYLIFQSVISRSSSAFYDDGWLGIYRQQFRAGAHARIPVWLASGIDVAWVVVNGRLAVRERRGSSKMGGENGMQQPIGRVC